MNDRIQSKINEFKTLHPDKRILAVFQTGSHLFKLNTENSDIDLTGIYMPSNEEVLSKKFSKEITLHTNKANTANTKDDIDCKFFSFKRFIELLMTGEFNSLELLFAPDYAVIQSSSEWEEIVKMRENFVIFNIASFLGFVKTEYRKAGFTGNVIEEMKTIHDFIQNLPEQDVLKKHFEGFKQFKFIKIKPTAIDNSGSKKYIDSVVIGSRLFQETTKIGYMKKELEKILNTNSSSKRKDKDGVDYKGLYHCRRLLYEAKSLIEKKALIIPFPENQHETLMNIRHGKYTLDQLQSMIEKEIRVIRSLEDQLITNTHANMHFMEKYLFNLLAKLELEATLNKYKK